MMPNKETKKTAIQLTVEKLAALREHYPTPRGGIDWEAVTDAALIYSRGAKAVIDERMAPIFQAFEKKDMGSEANNNLITNLTMVISEYAIQTSQQEHPPRIYVKKSGKKWGFMVYGKDSAMLDAQEGFKTEAAAYTAAKIFLDKYDTPSNAQ